MFISIAQVSRRSTSSVWQNCTILCVLASNWSRMYVFIFSPTNAYWWIWSFSYVFEKLQIFPLPYLGEDRVNGLYVHVKPQRSLRGNITHRTCFYTSQTLELNKTGYAIIMVQTAELPQFFGFLISSRLVYHHSLEFLEIFGSEGLVVGRWCPVASLDLN